MSMIWPPQSVKMASTPSFLSALATRLPPEIFWLASAAALGAALSEDLLAAPAMFILLREHFHFSRFHYGAERVLTHANRNDSYTVSWEARHTIAPPSHDFRGPSSRRCQQWSQCANRRR